MARAVRRARGRASCARRRRRRSTWSSPGARRRRSTPGCARRRTSSSRARPPRTARAPARSTARRCVALTAGRDARGLRLAGLPRRRGDALGRDRPAGAAGVRAARAAARPRRADLRGLAGDGAARRPRRRRASPRRRAGACAPAPPRWPINARLGPGAAAARPAHGLLQPHRADRAGARRDRAARLDRRRGDHRRARAAALLPHHATTGASCSAGAAGGWRWARARTGARSSTPSVVEQTRRGAAADLPDARGPADRARLGRADRRLPHPPAGDRHARRAAARGRRSATPATASGPRTWRAARSPRSTLGRSEDAARWAWIDPPPKVVPPEPLRVAGATADPRRARAQGGGGGGRRPRRSGHEGARGDPFDDRTAHRALICR